MKLRCGLVLASLVAGAAVCPLAAAPRATESQAKSVPAATSNFTGGVVLSLRRSPDGVQLVIEGTGAGPVLQQSRNGDTWRGDLRITTPGSLRLGPQRMTLPEAGLQSVSFQGSGSDYQLQIIPMPGAPLSRPVVSADGHNLILTFAAPSQPPEQTAQFNLRQPGMVPQPVYAPPLQPRAVAPPLGDMAVGSLILENPNFVKIKGPKITLTLKDAPAKDALMLLARIGGYGFVMIDEKEPPKSRYLYEYQSSGANSSAKSTLGKVSAGSRPVTASFVGVSYDTAINSVLVSAGLQGRLEGSMLLVGLSASSKSFGKVFSKTYRLNQASSRSAAQYLNSLGAAIAFPGYVGALGINDVTQGADSGADGKEEANQDENSRSTKKATQADSYSPGVGPLVGLAGTTDPRLQAITLIGSSSIVAMAEQYLRMIDLRQRQVALSIKILDVTLDNNADINNSFAFRYGNNFIVSDEGRMVGAFNSYMPPGTVTDSALPPPSFNAIAAGANPARNPGLAYGQNNFYDFVRASIESRSTKVLASPTLILSENSEGIGGEEQVATIGTSQLGDSAAIGRPRANESFVTVGEQVIINYAVQAGQNGAPNTCQPELGIAGLTFGARVSRIDDNGFVTFTMSPQISASTRRQDVGGCGPIDILSVRRLDTGSARVRDGQTLVMTGVISDADQSEVTKWPILGDIPLVGQFFRSSSRQRQRRELVILVTPRVIDDDRGGVYGYGYKPETQEGKRFADAYRNGV